MVDDTSTGALQPGEANLTQAQTMDWFQEDKKRPGIAENTYIDIWWADNDNSQGIIGAGRIKKVPKKRPI